MEIIFLKENDNLFQVLANQGIDTRTFMKQLNLINFKLNNNKIGYFQFRINNEFLKICILPKIIDKNNNNVKMQEDFKIYLIKCIEIMYRYNKENYLWKNIDKNYMDIVNKYRKDEVATLESILQFKYLYALKNILVLLKRLNHFRYKNKSFHDYTIRGVVNLKKNIGELNKSKIHQIQKQRISYDEVANICYSIIQYFLKNKIEVINNNLDLKRYSYKIKQYIKYNFEIKNYKFNCKNILSYKVKKTFENRKLEMLLSNLLVLLDIEGYFNLCADSIIHLKCENIISLAFDPSLVYEYFVYNNELSKHSNVQFNRLNNINENSKNEVDNENRKEPEYYCFEGANRKKEKEINIKANPDFIVNNEVVKDCKWKIIDNLSDVKEEDIEKLKRDCIKKEINRGVLVYPLINFEHNKLHWGCNAFNSVEDVFIWTIEEQRIL